MKILIVGSGGREHALAWAIAASPLVTELSAAPGNAGIARVARCVPIAAEDVDALVAHAKEAGIDFVVVGPEAPLVAGLVDRLEAAGIPAFGPSAAAAALEGSKAFMKEILDRAGVPTARYRHFSSGEVEAARAYVAAEGAPLVVKADGLAGGKGVVVAETVADALAAVEDCLVGGRFGAAGAEVVIEECLTGPEVSFFALTDGEAVLPLASAQDHKRAYDGDEGPNTGGMGAFSPSPLVGRALEDRILDEIIRPTVAAMAEAGRPFKGVLYAGLMLTPDGPKVLEYNVRFGDPECQALMLRLKSDLLPALMAARDGTLAHVDLRWKDEAAVTVVMAANGYPGRYEKGTAIEGLEAAGDDVSTVVFHAGTREGPGGKILADGGRVLGVTALGATIAEARTRAYEAVDRISWPDGFCRRDIAEKA